MKTPSHQNAAKVLADNILDHTLSLCAKDIMQPQLITVKASDPLTEVERVLADANISGAPVLDEEERVLGVLSMRDLLNQRVDDAAAVEQVGYAHFDDDIDETEPVAFRRSQAGAPCAGDVMTTELASVGPNTTLRAIAGKMVEARVHRLLVLDGGRLVGIVSTMDVLGALAQVNGARGGT